jgi:hypothetical protein
MGLTWDLHSLSHQSKVIATPAASSLKPGQSHIHSTNKRVIFGALVAKI